MQDQENTRLHVLQAYDIARSAQEKLFDDITALAADLFDAPVTRIAFVAQDEVWHKASQATPSPELLPAEQTLCAQAVARDEPVTVLKDLDEIMLLARQRQVRTYAGALLRSSQGQGLGTLCVAGPEPRSFTAPELHVLHCLAELVVAALEKRR